MKEVNNYVSLIKFPSEFSRSQRSLDFRNLYKATEYKNFIFYTSIGLIDFLPQKYFNNVLKYIVFLRVLCQEKLNEDDFILSQNLIENFIFEYEQLYGVQHMTYNLHAHIHLPIQAFKFGPINKISAFAFEGMFKIFRDFFHGTNGYVSQIVKKLQLETDFLFNQYEKMSKIKNKSLSNFVSTIAKKKRFSGTLFEFNKFQNIDLNNEHDLSIKNMSEFRSKTIMTSYFLKKNNQSIFPLYK